LKLILDSIKTWNGIRRDKGFIQYRFSSKKHELIEKIGNMQVDMKDTGSYSHSVIHKFYNPSLIIYDSGVYEISQNGKINNTGKIRNNLSPKRN
jgi:hypothetical protein